MDILFERMDPDQVMKARKLVKYFKEWVKAGGKGREELRLLADGERGEVW